jgi:hypothetical protein
MGSSVQVAVATFSSVSAPSAAANNGQENRKMQMKGFTQLMG